jgi:hypothetical protein
MSVRFPEKLWIASLSLDGRSSIHGLPLFLLMGDQAFADYLAIKHSRIASLLPLDGLLDGRTSIASGSHGLPLLI